MPQFKKTIPKFESHNYKTPIEVRIQLGVWNALIKSERRNNKKIQRSHELAICFL